ncbi:MAG: cupin [Rubrivivax sp.]|nr:cupin [Rubrivivax sp.]
MTSTPGAALATATSASGATSEGGAPLAATGSGRVWPTDPAGFTTARMQAIGHSFEGHALMQVPALAALAKRLFPTKQCRFIKPGATQTSEFDHDSADSAGRSIDEVFARIEEPGSWIALYNVETDPQYRGFLDEVAASVRALVEREEPGMYQVGGFIFVSAPPSVTPFHIDREHNFWLQVRGHKVMSVFDHCDTELVPAADRERFILYGNNVGLRQPGHLQRARDFRVGPGDGVYFPSTSPHMTRCEPGWARPGDGVSISIGVVFYTSATKRHAYVHACNEALRRRGLQPRPPGEVAWLDRLKAPLGRALVDLGRRRGYKPTPSFL